MIKVPNITWINHVLELEDPLLYQQIFLDFFLRENELSYVNLLLLEQLKWFVILVFNVNFNEILDTQHFQILALSDVCLFVWSMNERSRQLLW